MTSWQRLNPRGVHVVHSQNGARTEPPTDLELKSAKLKQVCKIPIKVCGSQQFEPLPCAPYLTL
jgi:hypothetical protein